MAVIVRKVGKDSRPSCGIRCARLYYFVPREGCVARHPKANRSVGVTHRIEGGGGDSFRWHRKIQLLRRCLGG